MVKAWLDGKADKQRWAREDRVRFHEERSKAYGAFLKAIAAIEQVNSQGILHLQILAPNIPDPLGSLEAVTTFKE